MFGPLPAGVRRGLEDTTRLYRFRFRERFTPASADTFLSDFFNSAAVRERFQACGSRRGQIRWGRFHALPRGAAGAVPAARGM